MLLASVYVLTFSPMLLLGVVGVIICLALVGIILYLAHKDEYYYVRKEKLCYKV